MASDPRYLPATSSDDPRAPSERDAMIEQLVAESARTVMWLRVWAPLSHSVAQARLRGMQAALAAAKNLGFPKGGG